MTDARDEQDQAEALDVDKMPGDTDDPEGDLLYPPDELLGADEYGTTPQEERFDEPLSERVARERPDPLAQELDRRARGSDRPAG
jgi:hypothetical protein